MIKSKSEYKNFYKSDLISTGIYGKKWYNRISDPRFKFYRSLRYTEYYYNCKNKFYHKLIKVTSCYQLFFINFQICNF